MANFPGVVDRFAEFRAIASQHGIETTSAEEMFRAEAENIGGVSSSFSLSAKAAKDNKDGGMKLFFEEVKAVQDRIAEAKRSTDEISQCTEDLLMATTAAMEQKAQDRLEVESGKTNEALQDAKKKLEKLREESLSGQGSRASKSEQRVRQNMCQSLAKKLQTQVLAFQNAQGEFSTEMKAKTARQLKLACPEASENEIHDMIESGETRDTMVRKQMAGTHAVLLENLEQVHDKYKAIRRLERSMADLHQMFLDMAQLIEHQGEILDVIEVNVSKTRDYTQQAEQELITARKGQLTSQRRMCCITVLMMLVCAVIIFPILFAPSAGIR
ncbi:unnamed protein product [Amoebophrya sp. A25]|nr:unnamed protein product [Amoebophrya sp. A25]|eukprot:GSA25T00003225001.1